jgi:hypothetical protein
VALRLRTGEDLGSQPLDDVIERLREATTSRRLEL